MPEYKHLVWNRTDLTVSQGNLSVTYTAAQRPLINEDKFPPDKYKGEVIPPYAAMRVLTNPVWYKNRRCFPVCRPDDNSMSVQASGMHFFNGSSPIMVGGYGEATNDLPAPVLVDLTVGAQQLPYGNIKAAPSNPSATGADVMFMLLGFASGSWALHPAGDIINYGPNGLLKLGDVSIPSGSVTMLAAMMPYVFLGQEPIRAISRDAPKTESPTVAFEYSKQIALVGLGALGFGSVVATGQ